MTKFVAISTVDLPFAGADAPERALELLRAAGTIGVVVHAVVRTTEYERMRHRLIDLQRVLAAGYTERETRVRALVDYAEAATQILVSLGTQGLKQ